MTRKRPQKALPPKKRYPTLPKHVMGAGGPLVITIVEKVSVKGEADEDVLGCFTPTERKIEIVKSLRPDQRWLVLYHELTHAALWDSGAANTMSDAVQELICDAIASSRLRERFG